MKEKLIEIGITMGYAAALTLINKTTESVADKVIKEKIPEDADDIKVARAKRSKKIKALVISNIVTFAAAVPLSAVTVGCIGKIDDTSDAESESATESSEVPADAE